VDELKSNASLYPSVSSLSRTIYPDTRSISGTKGIVGNKGETDGQKNSSSTSLSSELEREREELNKMRKEKEEEMAKYQHEKERIIKVPVFVFCNHLKLLEMYMGLIYT
jgi:hypothetical protein